MTSRGSSPRGSPSNVMAPLPGCSRPLTSFAIVDRPLPDAPRIADAAKSVGVSPRHLRRAVARVAGESPKYLQRLHRFNRLIAEVDEVERPAWASLAVGHGFYDQAHLIGEVRSFTGLTPRVLHTERRSQPVPFFQSPSAVSL